MRAIFSSFTHLPIWLRVSILVIEGLFLLILAGALTFQFSQLSQLQRERQGGADALELTKQLSLLSKYSADCALAATPAPEASTYTEICRDSKEKFEVATAAAETLASSAIQHRHGESEHSEMYHPDFTSTEPYLKEFLGRYFTIYTESGIQLNSVREAYTTGRLVLVHLPELYAYITIARDEALMSHNAKISNNHLLETQGAVHRIAEQAENTLGALLQSDNTPAAQQLSNQMLDFHKQLAGYFDWLSATRFTTPNRTGFERDLQQIEIADELLQSLADLKSRVAERFDSYLVEAQSETHKQIMAMVLLSLVLQTVLMLLFTAVTRSVKAAQSSAERLKATLEKQDKMFAIIGHELRTPAAAMKMQLDELSRTRTADNTVEELKSTSEHLLDVLDDMRVGSDHSITSEYKVAASFSVYKLCEETVHALFYLAGRYRVDLFLNASARSSMESYGYKKQLRQILINLVKNALIHAQAFRVELRLQTDELEGNKTAFTISVIDDGKGIPEADRERLFEAYERGETTSSGSGLGLNVSRELVREFEQGELEYLPGASGGSVFRLSFTLPNYQPEESKRVEDASTIQGKRILLVEDTPTLLMLGHAILSRAGAEVVDATDGSIGLQLAADQAFDLVITDIMMPKMDGYEMTQKLRAQGFTNPIIGVTGATVGHEADRLLECGATAVLPKPLTLDNLYAALQEDRA